MIDSVRTSKWLRSLCTGVLSRQRRKRHRCQQTNRSTDHQTIGLEPLEPRVLLSAVYLPELELSALDGSNGFVINGVNSGDQAGFAVSSAGDLNRDGIDDVVIGAFGSDPGTEPSRDRAGTTYVVFGTDSGFPASLELSALDGTNGFIINGIDPLDRSGLSVSSAGDLNNDGYNDLLVGAYTADPNGRSSAGEIYVLFSKTSFPAVVELSTLTASDGFVIHGVNNGDQAGRAISSLGDVNADGIDDIIIGASFADPNGQTNAGAAYVVFGKNTAVDGPFSAPLELSSLNGSNGFVINGHLSGDRTGIAVNSAGDVNGDGLNDMIIGASVADRDSKTDAGVSYLIFGKSTGFAASLELSALVAGDGFMFKGINAGDNAGNAVASAGDFNGDGLDDLVIGAVWADPLGRSRAGESYVVFGSTTGFSDLSALDGTNGFSINGGNADDHLGSSVSSAGDINGDGFDDLLIGSLRADISGGRGNTGKTYVMFGNAGPHTPVFDISSLDGTNGFVVNGERIGDQSGGSVRPAGDINDDGLDDIIIGAYLADPNGNVDAGAAYVLFGCGMISDNIPPVFTSPNTVSVPENTTAVHTLSATASGLPAEPLTFSITGNGADDVLFQITGGNQLEFITAPDFETPLDADENNVYEVEVEVGDGNGLTAIQTVHVSVLNQASITGVVFVDVNSNGMWEADEPGIDGVTIELLDTDDNVLETATTSDGGFYLFEDLEEGTYRLHEVQPTGVTDGADILGSLGGTIVANDTMELALERTDASDYDYAEQGTELSSGDTATIGFWQNKQGQALINSAGPQLASWLSENFANVFGDVFNSVNSMSVADFYKLELFKQKGKKTAGPAKVDAQFMAVAFATYFTSSTISGGSVASGYGFNVTDTGIGATVVNIGTAGAAFGVENYTDRTIMQLLLATNSLTDVPDGISGFAHIYDQNGDGVIDSIEAALRDMANTIYTLINEQGDI